MRFHSFLQGVLPITAFGTLALAAPASSVCPAVRPGGAYGGHGGHDGGKSSSYPGSKGGHGSGSSPYPGGKDGHGISAEYPHGKDGHGKDSYGKDSYGKDSYGKVGHGKDSYGHGKDSYGHGKDSYGHGKDSYGHGKDSYGHGKDSYGHGGKGSSYPSKGGYGGDSSPYPGKGGDGSSSYPSKGGYGGKGSSYPSKGGYGGDSSAYPGKGGSDYPTGEGYPAGNSSYYPGGNGTYPGNSTYGLCNSPTNRACWSKKGNGGKGFDINTDYEETTPYTGQTRKYTFVITEIDNYVGGDGVTKAKAMLINGQFPGPTIDANWGDYVEVEVISKLRTNGTGIHWHGVRQLNNAIHDGAPGVTECPIAPGTSKTYKFHVTQYGSSWYHTHVSSQYAYGVTGSMQFNGPASANYDTDLGPLHISDWYYPTADQILIRMNDPTNPFIPGAPGSPPPSDNVLFNGKNINPQGSGGEYEKVTVTKGKTHLLRLINPSVENTFTFSIVGHKLKIVETDFVSVDPITVDEVYIGLGQRYNVIIDASEEVGNYWMNISYSVGPCGTSNNPNPAAILSYEGAEDSLPTDPGSAPADSFCTDSLAYTPIVSRSAPAQTLGTVDDTLPVTLQVTDGTTARVFWQVNGSAIDVTWEKPVLQYVKDGENDFPRSENIIKLPDANEWAFWVVNNLSPIPHPMHLHGHDFLVLGQSPGLANPFDGDVPKPFTEADNGSLNFDNPTRRDSTMLPSFGWVVVAFRTDNPGSWPFHCHIAWHASQGLAVDFLERSNEIADNMDLDFITPNCEAWRAYIPTDPFQKYDSGI